MKDFMQGVGALFGSALFFVCVALIAGLWFAGAEWLSVTVYPWISVANELTFAVCLFVFLPMAAFRATRSISGISLFIASYIFGFTLWIYSFLVAYVLWGTVGLIIGLFFLGVGVVPIAFLASLFHGEWAALGQVVLGLFLLLGTRLLGGYLVQKSDEAKQPFDTNLY